MSKDLDCLIDRIDTISSELASLKSDLGQLQSAAPSDVDRGRQIPVRHRISRFLTTDDPNVTRLVYDLPETWWSRRYEYAWAAELVREADTVLDVACGVGHPFKFFLAEHALAAYACDSDPRIASRDAILADIRETVSGDEYRRFDPARIGRVRLDCCDMTRMPYGDKTFDLVYCLSVLEHVAPPVQIAALEEFARVLNDDGLIAMTVDYPTVNIHELTAGITAAGLRFAGPTDFAIPENAISSALWGPELRCIRLLLCKL